MHLGNLSLKFQDESITLTGGPRSSQTAHGTHAKGPLRQPPLWHRATHVILLRRYSFLDRLTVFLFAFSRFVGYRLGSGNCFVRRGLSRRCSLAAHGLRPFNRLAADIFSL